MEDIEIGHEISKVAETKNYEIPFSHEDATEELDDSTALIENFWETTVDEKLLEKTCMDPELCSYASTFDINNKLRKSYFGCKHDESLVELSKVSPLGNTLLHFAASVGDVEHVKAILRFEDFSERMNKQNNTPVHIAAAAGHLSTVRFLGDCYGSSLMRLRNGKGNTPLHAALQNHHLEVAKLLIGIENSILHSANYSGDTPFSLAVEAGNLELVQLMMSQIPGREISNFFTSYGCKLWELEMYTSLLLRSSIVGRNKDVQKIIFTHFDLTVKNTNQRDEEGMTPLTRAAYMDNIDAVRWLLDVTTKGAFKEDGRGFTPIHLASREGHITIVAEFLKRCPHTKYLLDSRKWNILHVAVWHRRDEMVKYIINNPDLEMLLNNRDEFGNTPLHLAVRQGYPMTVSILVSKKKLELSIKNNAGDTAMEVSIQYMTTGSINYLRRGLTYMALRLADASRYQETSSTVAMKMTELGVPYHERDPELDSERQAGERPAVDAVKQTVSNLVLVSILVVTVTFAAGFTVPGGYNNSGNNEGMATLVTNWPFQVFLICNTIAMYSSMTLAIILLWVAEGNAANVGKRVGLPLFGLSLAMMLVAFMAGVYSMTSNLFWLSMFVVVAGSVFLIITVALIVPSCGLSFNSCISRFMLHCVFRLLVRLVTYNRDTLRSM